jgi:hypothetical protein
LGKRNCLRREQLNAILLRAAIDMPAILKAFCAQFQPQTLPVEVLFRGGEEVNDSHC